MNLQLDFEKVRALKMKIYIHKKWPIYALQMDGAVIEFSVQLHPSKQQTVTGGYAPVGYLTFLKSNASSHG